MPATANTIGKIANGIVDDLLTTATLAVTCPVIFCPNMNEDMLKRKTIQRNLLTLKKDGYKIMETGLATQLSAGKKVKGGLPLPDEFVKHLEKVFNYEPIDL